MRPPIGARISVHVGMRLTGVHVNHVLSLHQLGLMGPDTTYIHCTDSTDEELDLIASTGGSASVAPFVEMLMGHGVPPTGRPVAVSGISISRVREGKIPNFTGIDSPYEAPLAPDIELHTDRESLEESLEKLTRLALGLARPDPRTIGAGEDI